jgi:hypothetical protein
MRGGGKGGVFLFTETTTEKMQEFMRFGTIQPGSEMIFSHFADNPNRSERGRIHNPNEVTSERQKTNGRNPVGVVPLTSRPRVASLRSVTLG